MSKVKNVAFMCIADDRPILSSVYCNRKVFVRFDNFRS